MIEMVDTEKKIREFLPKLDELLDKSGKGALVFLEEIEIVRYRKGNKYQ